MATQSDRSGFGQWLLIGYREIASGIANWRIVHLMGISDLRRRYARSRLGQFWLVASTGIMVVVLGAVWSMLWKMPAHDLMPYIAVALVLWTVITGALGEAPTAFIAAGPLLLNQGTSYSTVILAVLYRQLLIFLHNVTIAVLILIVFRRPLGAEALLAIPGFLLLLLNIAWPTYVIAIASTRFRDLASVVSNVLVIAFLVTPVFWEETQIPPEHNWIIRANPFALLLSLVRDPILGKVPEGSAWLVASLLGLVGCLLTLVLIGKYRHRIIYWL